VDEDCHDEETKKRGAGFRKQANSRTAREMRAAAAERRSQLPTSSASDLRGSIQSSMDGVTPEASRSGNNDDDDFEIIAEDDSARLERLFAGECKGEQEHLSLHMESNETTESDAHASGSAIGASTQSPRPKRAKLSSYVRQEINDRQKESLGLDSRRTIGAAPASRRRSGLERCDDSRQWVCSVCTLINHTDCKSCAACETLRTK